jgi:hypothetical protein
MRLWVIGAMTIFVAAGCTADPLEQSDASDVANSEAVVQQWAGELCAATDSLQAQVTGIASSIEIDPSAGLNQLPQIYAQLQGSVAELEAEVDTVESVLRKAPASSPEAVAFAAQVQPLVQSARSSGQEALTSAEEAVNADNFLGAGVAAAGALAAAQQARADAGAALELVNGARTGQDPQLQDAFAGAPECQSNS